MSSNLPPVKVISPEPGTPALEALIAHALSQAPSPSIPATFAATVARRATAQPLAQTPLLSGWGPRLALLSIALLTVAMFALAPHATPSLSSLSFDAELLLLAELGILLLFANHLLRHD